ncbi:MAG: hypothetical protein QM749_03025 [Aquabacterium sp.]
MTKKTGMAMASNVRHIKREGVADDLTLPDNFAQADGFGFKGMDSTPGGRVVRLGDVVRWLESTRPCPQSEAIDLVLNALQPDHMPALCELDRAGKHARPIDVDGRFGCPTQDELSAAWARRKAGGATQWRYANAPAGSGGVYTLVPEPGSEGGPAVATAPGLPALLDMVKRELKKPAMGKLGPAASPIDDSGNQAGRLAILLTVAYELWWRGCPRQQGASIVVEDEPASDALKTFAQLAAFRKVEANKGTAWTDDMKVILFEEKAKRTKKPGAKGVASAMASDLGVTVTFLNKKVSEGEIIAKARDKDDQSSAVHRLK